MRANIEHLRAVGRAATEGPWEHTRHPFRDDAMHSVKRGQMVIASVGYEVIEPDRAAVDAEFIATARNEWDGLLDEVVRLRGQVARVEALAAKWDDDSEGRHVHWAAVPKIRAALADESEPS